MSSREVIRIVRPYSSLDAYLSGDAWTVDRADMLLVGAAPLPPNTPVKFEIVLSTADPVVVGEGRVMEHVAASGQRPAGLRVRFRQLSDASKAVLRRALEAQKRGAKAPPAEAPPPEPMPMQATTVMTSTVDASEEPTAGAPAATPSPPPDRSGVRAAGPPPAPPENRDALLERLRERARLGKAPANVYEQRKAAAE